jgi:murein DD-endopeptidase MepM/ murein hydrolase activator NlpD
MPLINFQKLKIKILFSIILITSGILSAEAATPTELKYAISEKEKALQAVTNQIRDAQKNLIETEQKAKNLSKEIKRIDYSINQLNLGIKSSEITIDKLELEIVAVQYEIQEAEAKSALKKSAIRSLLKSLSERDDESLLLALLKTKTLADGMLEIESLNDLNGGLAEEVKILTNFKNDLSSKLLQREKKKGDLVQENRNLRVRKGLVEEQKLDRKNLLAQTSAQEKQYQRLLTDLEKKQAEISEEIEAIEEELRKKIDPSLLPSKRPGVLLRPTQGYTSQEFGYTSFAQRSHYVGKFHNGLDIAAPIGSPIVAAEAGKILKIGDSDRFCRRGAYGKYIAIEHSNNLTTLYAHLSAFNPSINEGMEVSRGDVIGYVGRTGYATGPHLHFGVYSSLTFYVGKSRSCGPLPYGGYLDPMDYL